MSSCQYLLSAFIALSLLLTSTLTEEQECAVDERMNIKLKKQSVIEPSVILVETAGMQDENECYRSCCDFIATGAQCNAASYYREGPTFICINAKCQDFNDCEFEYNPFALSAKVAIFNTSVNFDESEETNPTQASNGTASENATSSTNATAGSAESDETIEEEVEELFESDSDSDKWNILYNFDYSTSTLGYYDYNSEVPDTTNNEGHDMTNQQPTQGSQGSTASNKGESTTSSKTNTINGGGVEGGSNSQHEGETEVDNTGDVDVIKPHLTHGNSGIYGPNEVPDFDYSSTPLIIIGVVVTVLFLLLLLVFVGRKMIHNDRLKYRPLRDSFPAANAYHDLEQ